LPGSALAWSTNWPPGAQALVVDDGDVNAELVGRAGLSFADALVSGQEGIELPATLALLLGADLGGSRGRQGEGRLDGHMAFDLAADVTDQRISRPKRAQDAQFPRVRLNCLARA
jgi:hypothetical protein